MTVTLLVLGAIAAVADWVAAQQRLFRLEYGLKPLPLLLLILAAASADLGAAQPWIVAGLVFGLLGDVALMIADDDRADAAFVAGLAAFLAGHICYIVGFARTGVRFLDLLAGLLVVVGVAGLALPQILRGAARTAGRRFAAVVGAYAAVLGGMSVLAAGTGIAVTAIGGVLFLASDTLLARQRFVAHIKHGPVLVIVTYHLAQFLIVIGLARAV